MTMGVTSCAAYMEESAFEILDGVVDTSGEKPIAHIYTAQDGTTLTIVVTRYEAYLLERKWYGETLARENYHRLDD